MFRSFLVNGVSACLALLACSTGQTGPTSGTGGRSDAGGGDSDTIDIDGTVPEDSGGVGGKGLDPLCGEGKCNPDDALACGGGGTGGGGGAGGASGSGSGGDGTGGSGTGGSGTGGSGTGGAGGGSGTAGMSGSGGEGASGGMAGEAGAAGASPAQNGELACRVERSDGDLVRSCAAAGPGPMDAPCLSSADCEAGLACVFQETGAASQCRPYCCAGMDACTSGNYCTPRALRVDAQGTRGSEVPVCVPGDNCKLDEAYPCAADQTCVCRGDEACLVVRGDGTTACGVPGDRQAGDTCSLESSQSCGWGLVCSQTTHTCLKLCRIGSDATADAGDFMCEKGQCQSAATLPGGWGVCVGSTLQ